MNTLLKTLHLLAACLFLGNIIVSAVWKVLADRSGDLAVARYACRLVNLTDLAFTAPGATLLLATGHLMAGAHGGVVSNPWMLWSYVLLSASGAIWLLVLLPVQFRQSRLLRDDTLRGVPAAYHPLARRWAFAGTLATLLPLPALYLMVGQARL